MPTSCKVAKKNPKKQKPNWTIEKPGSEHNKYWGFQMTILCSFPVVPYWGSWRRQPSRELVACLWPAGPDTIWPRVSERVYILGANGGCVYYGGSGSPALFVSEEGWNGLLLKILYLPLYHHPLNMTLWFFQLKVTQLPCPAPWAPSSSNGC